MESRRIAGFKIKEKKLREGNAIANQHQPVGVDKAFFSIIIRLK